MSHELNGYERSDEMKTSSLAGILILLTFILMSCEPSSPSPAPIETPMFLETKNPSIRGIIKSISTPEGKITGIYIEGIKEADTTYDRASVGFNDETHFYFYAGGDFMETDATQLEVGQTVEAWFTGSVATSYPVQAWAIEIVILK